MRLPPATRRLVVANLGVVRDGALIAPADFEIAYVVAECGEQRVALTDVWAVRLEECLPVRRFPSYKGQRNHVGTLVGRYDRRSHRV